MKLVALSLVALTATAGATPGTQRKREQPHGRALPAWCIAGTDRFSYRAGDRDKATDVRTQIEATLAGLCSEYGVDDADIPKFEALRQKVMAAEGMTDEDWPDAVAWVVRSQWDVPFDRHKAWSAFDAIDQVGALEHHEPANGDVVYMADAFGTNLSAAGRFAIADRCLMDGMIGHATLAWCALDVDALDAKKALAEVHALKAHQPIERMTVRMIIDRVQTKMPDLQKKLADAKAQDGQLFQIAADARKDWDAHPPDAKLLAAALAADDAHLTGTAIDGCTDKVWPLYQAAVAAIPAKKFGALKSDDAGNLAAVIEGDRDGYLAASALSECGDVSPSLAAILATRGNQYWPGFRGPRTAAMSAMVGVGGGKGGIIRVDHGSTQRPQRTQGGNSGAISAAKTSGDKVDLAFKKDLRKEEACSEGHDTNHILGIGVTGAIQYEYVCTKYTTITYDTAPKPTTVAARYAAGVKPGVTLYFEGDVVVWVRPKAKADPIAVLGVSVK